VDGRPRRGSAGSINAPNPTSGTIDVSAHFDAWAQIPAQPSPVDGASVSFTPSAQLYEVSFTVEGFGGFAGGWVCFSCGYCKTLIKILVFIHGADGNPFMAQRVSA